MIDEPSRLSVFGQGWSDENRSQTTTDGEYMPNRSHRWHLVHEIMAGKKE
jgi:hypothetical protein